MTTGQVAAFFGVTRRTVQKWADEGVLPCSRTLGGDRRFDRGELERILDREQ